MSLSYLRRVRSLFQDMDRFTFVVKACSGGISTGKATSFSSLCLLSLVRACTPSSKTMLRAPCTSSSWCTQYLMVHEQASELGTLLLETGTRLIGYS